MKNMTIALELLGLLIHVVSESDFSFSTSSTMDNAGWHAQRRAKKVF